MGGWVAGEQATSGGFVLLFVNLVLRSGVLPHSCSGDVYLCCSRGEHVGRCQAGAVTLLLKYGGGPWCQGVFNLLFSSLNPT